MTEAQVEFYIYDFLRRLRAPQCVFHGPNSPVKTAKRDGPSFGKGHRVFGAGGEAGLIVLSHPSDKNKDVARVGHPEFCLVRQLYLRSAPEK